MCYFIQRNVVVCVAARHDAEEVHQQIMLVYNSSDCTTKETQLRIKLEFVVILNSTSYKQGCQGYSVCGVDSEVTRRKQETLDLTHNVEVRFDFFIKLRKEANLDWVVRWVELDDAFEKMVEHVRQSIDSGRFNLTVRDVTMQVKRNSFEEMSPGMVRCPPQSLPREGILCCGMSFTYQHSDNSLFRPMCSSVLLS